MCHILWIIKEIHMCIRTIIKNLNYTTYKKTQFDTTLTCSSIVDPTIFALLNWNWSLLYKIYCNSYIILLKTSHTATIFFFKIWYWIKSGANFSQSSIFVITATKKNYLNNHWKTSNTFFIKSSFLCITFSFELSF